MIKSAPPLDAFGPESDHPYLFIDTEDTTDGHTGWLENLPCPIIGVGHGMLNKFCDILLTDTSQFTAIAENIKKAPLTAMVLVQHLRSSQHLSLENRLIAESLAYATVQNGPEFNSCLASDKDQSKKVTDNDHPLKIEMTDTELSISLDDPDNQNAIGVVMRDALCEALDLALINSDIEKVNLTGNGRVFSTGGDVAEFGEVSDPATAHWIRSLRLPATRLAKLTDKLSIHVNGPAIGAGCEILAFGQRVTASPNAWFQLPELKYGLIPGAGGTAGLPKRIGRQKTAYLALSMKKINADIALDWGLIDEIIS